MARFFDILFNLEILHDYYVSGKSHDFIITPTVDTIRLTKGLRGLNKFETSAKNGVGTAKLTSIFEAVDESETPLIPISTAERFRFTMKLVNQGFLNFTALPVKNNNSEIYYYTNDSGDLLTEELIELRHKIFRYQFNFVGSLTALKIKGIDGAYIPELEVALSGGPDYDVELDLTNYPSGKYVLEIFDGATSEGTKNIYFDNEILAQGVFGIIELVKDNNTKSDFTIQYTSKESNWKYFVVVKDGLDVEDYSVVDAGVSPIGFTPEIPVDYDLQVANALKSNYVDSEVVLFVSDEILFSEIKRKDFQLVKAGTPETILINNLPNPSVEKPSPEVYVFV